MNEQSTADLVKAHPFVRGFPAHETDRLAALGRQVRFAKDEVIFREGEEVQDFYLLVSGRVALEVMPPTGPVRVDTVEPGDEFGWTAVLRGSGYVLQARAVFETKAIAFDGAQLRAACEAEPAFGYGFTQRLLALAAERLQAARLQLMEMHWPVAKAAGA